MILADWGDVLCKLKRFDYFCAFASVVHWEKLTNGYLRLVSVSEIQMKLGNSSFHMGVVYTLM
jgi:hypothetical protein